VDHWRIPAVACFLCVVCELGVTGSVCVCVCVCESMLLSQGVFVFAFGGFLALDLNEAGLGYDMAWHGMVWNGGRK